MRSVRSVPLFLLVGVLGSTTPAFAIGPAQHADAAAVARQSGAASGRAGTRLGRALARQVVQRRALGALRRSRWFHHPRLAPTGVVRDADLAHLPRAERERIQGERLLAEVEHAVRAHPSSIDAESLVTHGNRVRFLEGSSEVYEAMESTIREAEGAVYQSTMILEKAPGAKIAEAVSALHEASPDVPYHLRLSTYVAHRRGVPFPLPERASEAAARVHAVFGRNLRQRPAMKYAITNARRTGRGFFKRLIGLNVSHTKNLVAGARDAAGRPTLKAVVTDMNLDVKGLPAREGGGGWFETGVELQGPSAYGVAQNERDAIRLAAPHVTLPPAPPRPEPFDDGVPVVLFGQHAGAGRNSSAHQGFATAIRGARRHVYMLHNSLNDWDLLLAAAEATEQVPVHIMLSEAFLDDAQKMPGQGGGNLLNLQRLVRMAVNPDNVVVHWFPAPESTEDNPVAAHDQDDGTSHAKLIVVDDLLIDGSKNADSQSHISSELAVGVLSRTLATQAIRMYERLARRAPRVPIEALM